MSIDISNIKNLSKKDRYKLSFEMIKRQYEEESFITANLANTSAIIYHLIEGVSWCGFYIYKDNMLILGPFQGKPACNRIAFSKGVCGTALKERQTIIVNDVSKFPGHIACDKYTKSEIVVPLYKQSSSLGVLDMDSYNLSNFDDVDKTELEKICDFILQKTDFSKI